MIFQWEFYLYKHIDLQVNGLVTEQDALDHWVNHGKNELRIFCDIPILFDWKNYILLNDGLNHIQTEEDAWKHFLYFGCSENRLLQHNSFLKIYGIKKNSKQ
jgi:hypothetical protein